MEKRKKRNFLDLNRNLITYILEFNSRKDSSILLNIKNHILLRCLLRIDFIYNEIFEDNPTLLKPITKIEVLHPVLNLMNKSVHLIKCQFENSDKLYSLFCIYERWGDNYMAYPTYKNDLVIYDITKYICKGYLTWCHADSIMCIKYFPIIDKLLTCSKDRSLKIWNLNDYLCIHSFYIMEYSLYYVLFFPCQYKNNVFIITAVNKIKELDVYDYYNKQLVKTLGEKDSSLFISYWLSGENLYIINATLEGVKLYEFESGKMHRFFKDDKDCINVNILAKNDNILIVSVNKNGKIHIRELNSTRLVYSLDIRASVYAGLLWNMDYLLLVTYGKLFIIELTCGKIEENDYLNRETICLNKFYHPKLGECIITAGSESILIWAINQTKQKEISKTKFRCNIQ